MADERISVEVALETSKSAKSLGDLKQAAEVLRQELEGTEIGSARFNEIAGAVQTAESQVKTLEKTFEGLEPQQIADSFVKVGEAIAGGFAAAQGAALLFGEENEDVQEQLVKAQAAVSIAVGARAAAEGILQGRIALRATVEKLGIVTTNGATIAQRIFNAVLNANPIAKVIALLAGLGTALVAVAAFLTSTTKEQQLLNKAGQEAAGAIAEEVAQLDTLTQTAQNANLSLSQRKEAIEEINKISPQFLGNIDLENISTQETADAIKEYNKFILKKAELDAIASNKAELLTEKIRLQIEAQTGQNVGFLDYIGALQTGQDAQDIANASTQNAIAAIEEQTEVADGLIQTITEETAVLEENTLATGRNVAERSERQDKLNEISQKERADRQQAIKDAEEFAQREADALRELEQVRIDTIEDDQERALEQLKFDQDIALQKIEDLKISEDTKNALRLATEEQFQQDLLQLQIDQAVEAQQILDDLIVANTTNQFERDRLIRQQEFDARILELEEQGLLTNEIQTELERQLIADLEVIKDEEEQFQIDRDQTEMDRQAELAQARIDLARQEQEAKLKFGEETAKGLLGLLEASEGDSEASARRAFERNKKIAIAQALIDTFLGAQRIFSSAAANPATVLFPAQPFIQAGIAIATGLKNVNNIRKQKFQGGSSGSASVGSGAGAGLGSSGFSGEAPVTEIGGGESQTTTQQPSKVVLVETDVTEGQGVVDNIEQSAVIE